MIDSFPPHPNLSFFFETAVLETASPSGTENDASTPMSTQEATHPRARETVRAGAGATAGRPARRGQQGAQPALHPAPAGFVRQSRTARASLALQASASACHRGGAFPSDEGAKSSADQQRVENILSN